MVTTPLAHKKRGERGFISMIVTIVITILIIIYFGDDIKKFLEKNEVKDILRRGLILILYLWEHFVKGPLMRLINRG